MEEIKNIDNIDNNDNNTTDKKRKYVFTEKRQAAFDKMKEARRQQPEQQSEPKIIYI